jgi:hypothetical protein
MRGSQKMKKKDIGHFCPRQNAKKYLNDEIKELQQKQHGIVLILDAN